MNDVVRILYAGSLETLLMQDIFPHFEAATGYRCQGQAGGSRETAQKLRAGEAEADIFLSADAHVNEVELMGEENGRTIKWYMTFATNEMVLAYSRHSVHHSRIECALQCEDSLLALLCSDLRLCRTDPETDPKGYRAIQAVQLLALQYRHLPLVTEVLGEAQNPLQIIAPPKMMEAITRGEYDIGLTYRNQAVESDLPFLPLPACANLGIPEYADTYAQAIYQCADGAIYRGAPISYTAAMLRTTRHPLTAAAFLTFLTTRQAASLYEQHGFRAIPVQLRGGV